MTFAISNEQTGLSTIRIFLSTLLICFGIQGIAQIYPSSPQPWRAEYEIDVAEVEFSHPMTVINSDELAIIKERIQYNVEPQNEAFTQLIDQAESALGFSPNPPATLDIPGGYDDRDGLQFARDLLWMNCHPAYTSALAYALTDSSKYADKALEILMAWTNAGTTFTGDDRGLQLGSWFSPMLYAADLIYHYEGWSEADKDSFKAWWRKECLNNGDVIGVMRRKDNNWKDAALLGVFAASVVMEDHTLLQEALIQLRSYFFSRTDGNVRLKGPGWKIEKDERGVYLPREVVRNDGRSGLTYTAYALTTMVQCFEIARYAGFDYWQNETEQGATIGDVINQYFAWDIQNDAFPWGSPNKSGKRRNHYELANIHLPVAPELRAFIESNRPLVGREGDAYATLNKGDMFGTDLMPPGAPGDLMAQALSSTKIQLMWTDNATNEYGFMLERNEAGEFVPVAVIPSNTGTYLDTGLVAATSYTYRIAAFNAGDSISFSGEATTSTQSLPLMPPAVPTAFVASSSSTDVVQLTWSDNSSDEEGFEIQRKDGDGAFARLALVEVNETSYSDEQVEGAASYTYRIRGYNAAGNSEFSNESSVTMPDYDLPFLEAGGIVSMEAEHGVLGSYWQKGTSEIASSGEYIEVDPSQNASGETPECTAPRCLASYAFNITTNSGYRFWYRLLSESGEDDSFFWRIDNGGWKEENRRSGGDGWFSTRIDDNDLAAVPLHHLEVSYRENGTQLDKFIIQVEGLDRPMNMGPAESDRGMTTSINAPDSREQTALIGQNYPNPFKQSTQVDYRLLSRAEVKIDVIDSSGRNIENLARAHMPAGDHTATWSPRNSVSPGVYFLRFEIEHLVHYVRIVLL